VASQTATLGAVWGLPVIPAREEERELCKSHPAKVLRCPSPAGKHWLCLPGIHRPVPKGRRMQLLLQGTELIWLFSLIKRLKKRGEEGW